MIVENVNIYNLVPTKITKMINKLNDALKVIELRKQTISKTTFFEKERKNCT